MQVATVGTDSHVKLQSVTPGRDFGTSIELVSGLDANQDIIINPVSYTHLDVYKRQELCNNFYCLFLLI